jgi:methyltransferase (TIGR00027 family)
VPLAPIQTVISARTMSINPETGRLFLAAADITPNAPPDKKSGRIPTVPGSAVVLRQRLIRPVWIVQWTMTPGHLSETSYWMAYMRALEADRPDALFEDPYSRQLAGHIGEAVARNLGSIQLIANSIAVRTSVMDRLILDTVARLNVDLILNIGSGLDTRPWRLDLPERLTWMDVDLPAVLDHKSQTLANYKPNCQYRSVGADILQSAQRKGILHECSDAGRVLVITEGLLVYLRPTEVEDLARDLHSQPACMWWLTDLAGPKALERLRSEWAPKLPNIEFHFAPADSTSFFARVGWREAEFHSSAQEARRLRRAPPLPWLARILIAFSPTSEELRRLAGIAVLVRDTLPSSKLPNSP